MAKKNILIKTNNAGAWDELYPITASGNVKTTDGSDVEAKLGTKVDKVSGKKLSTEDYTTTEKNKLSGIATGANNYTHPSTHPSTMITMADSKTLEQYKSDVSTQLTDLTKLVAYGVSTGSANTYLITLNPTPSAYVDGLALSVKINVQNTGASTINVNGLGAKYILKGNGNAVSSGNLKAGSIYTLRYNGTSFILQGEGGEYGTATASDVLSGKTIGTESGIILGNIPVAPTYPDNNTISDFHMYPNLANGRHNMYFQIPRGYYDNTWVGYNMPTLVSENIKAGVEIGGGLRITGTYDKIYGVGDSMPLRNLNIATTGSTEPIEAPIVWKDANGQSSCYSHMCVLGNIVYYRNAITNDVNPQLMSKSLLTGDAGVGAISLDSVNCAVLTDNARNCVFALSGASIYRFTPNLVQTWKFSYSSTVRSNTYNVMAQDANFLYFMDYAAYIYKVNKDTGEQVWKVASGATNMQGLVLANENNLYIICTSGSYYVSKRNKDNGSEVSRYFISVPALSACIDDNNTVYLRRSGTDNSIYGYRDNSSYIYYNGYVPHSGVMFVANGLFYGATYMGTIYEMDLNFAKRYWKSSASSTNYTMTGGAPCTLNGKQYIVTGGYFMTLVKTFYDIV